MAREIKRRDLLPAAVAASATSAAWTQARSSEQPISDWARQKQYRTVKGVRMAYYEAGSGDPVVFLHGNPTS